MKPKQIQLDKIRIDGGTQPRVAIDEAVVNEYLRDMDAGAEFPPVEVYGDGATYWLTDGFHRYWAAEKLGWKSIAAVVHSGVKADAVWASLAANKTHGLRRSNEDKANAVRRALEVKPDLSNREIARHVGVDEGTVRRHRESLSAEVPQMRTVKRGDTTYTQDTANIGKAKAPEQPKPEPEREPEDQDAGTEAEQKPSKDAGKSGGKDVPRDCLGQPITDDRLAEAFSRRGEFTDLMHQVSEVKARVLKAIEAKDQLYSGISVSRFTADCNNVHRELSFAAPYAVCPYCGGSNRGCKACAGRGWVGKAVYESAPKELKKKLGGRLDEVG